MIRIFDIPVHNGSLSEIVEGIARGCSDAGTETCRCISASGAHGLVEARRDPSFSHVLQSFFVNLPDGMPVVWLGRLKGARAMERCYGPDLFREVLVKTAGMPTKHFFCGGKKGRAAELRHVAEKRFGNTNCVGVYSPPFRDMTEDEWVGLANAINAVAPHIIWIGLSTPKQELFALELSKRVHVQYIITVGAAFDIHTGYLRQAPHVVQRLGLEWLFRLAVEPRRLWRRYARVVPLFLYYAGEELLTGRKRRDSKKNEGRA